MRGDVTSPPAIVLGGSLNALSVVRRLARLGVHTEAVGTSRSLARRSRYCAAFHELDCPAGPQEPQLEWLMSHPRDAVLLPCDDDSLELIARHRPRLLELGYRPAESDDRVVLSMLDKESTYELARRGEIRTPRTRDIRSLADLDELGGWQEFPCAIKPIHSHRFATAYSASRKAFVVGDRAELDRRIAEMLRRDLEMQITEIVPGSEDQYVGYYAYIDEDGEPLFELTKRKLRQYPPEFGMGCYHVTSDEDDVAEHGARFLKAAGIRGLANVEMKRDSRDGALTLIECNHRFTAINELLEIAGIEVSRLAYERAAGRPVRISGRYRSGVRLWHPLRDLRAARRGNVSTRSWLASVAHRQHTPTFEVRDPLPSVAQGPPKLASYVRRRLRGNTRHLT